MTRPSKTDMPVVILCGGKGTRLREETEYRPKPMVEIGPQPILWHIMKIYGAHGLDRFLLCLGYKGWEIKRVLPPLRGRCTATSRSRWTAAEPLEIHNQDGSRPGGSPAPTPAPTPPPARRLRRVRKYIDAPTFCFTYGDAVGDVDIDALLDFHRSQGRIATVTGVHPTSRYGEMHVDGDARCWSSTRSRSRRGRGQRRLLRLPARGLRLPRRRPGPVPGAASRCASLARDGQLSVYLHEGFWHPMDTYRDYLHLNDLWKRGETPWKIW